MISWGKKMVIKTSDARRKVFRRLEGRARESRATRRSMVGPEQRRALSRKSLVTVILEETPPSGKLSLDFEFGFWAYQFGGGALQKTPLRLKNNPPCRAVTFGVDFTSLHRKD